MNCAHALICGRFLTGASLIAFVVLVSAASMAADGTPVKGGKAVDAQAPTTQNADLGLAIDDLLSQEPSRIVRGVKTLKEKSDRAVPRLIGAMREHSGNDYVMVVWALAYIGDERAVPELRQIVERSPEAVLSEATYGGVGQEGRSLYAREAIVHILEPGSRSWEGATMGLIIGGEESFAKSNDVQIAYHQRLKLWYKAWRVKG